jgi:hypothetical protein
MFRNSLRILFSNFTLVWKILVYKLLATLIVFSVATIFAMPLLEVLNQNNFFTKVYTEFSNAALNFNIHYTLNAFYVTINEFLSIVSANISQVGLSLTLVLATILILGNYIIGLSDLAVNEYLNGYMSSNANFSFTSSFVRVFPKAVKLQTAKLFINLPFNILIAFLIYLTLPLLNNTSEVIAIFAPFIIITLSTVLISANLTAFSGVSPAIVVHNCSIKKGFYLGLIAVNRRFYKTLSNAVIIVLSILTVNLFFLILTGGASLLVTLPSSIFLLAIFGMVMYYGSMGMRYYVDPDTILTPKKLEEQDSVNKTKFII